MILFISKKLLISGVLILLTGLSLCAKTVVLTDNTTTHSIRCANKIVVNSDVNLHGKMLTLPKNATFVFDGGRVSNGEIVFKNNLLLGDVKVLSKVSGTVKNDTLYVNWFLKGDDLDDLFNSGFWMLTGMKEIHLSQHDYVISVRSFKRGVRICNIVIDGENCTIHNKEGGSLVYSLLPFTNCYDITVKNINIKGAQKECGEAGGRHNIVLSACERVNMQNITSYNAYTDGLYIIGCKSLMIKGFKAFNSGRQGCSITSGEDIFFSNCVFDGSYLYPPMAGLDIEPNFSENVINNIHIRRCVFSNNKAAGLTLLLREKETSTPCNISVEDCEFTENGLHISVSSAPNSGIGVIDISNCQLSNSKGVSFQSKCYSAIGTPLVKFHDSYLKNANLGEGRDVREQATFISVHNLSSSPLQGDFGNIQLYNLTIKQDNKYVKNLKRVLNLYPDNKWSISNVTVSNISIDVDRKDDKSFIRYFIPNSRVKNVKVH